MGVGVGVVEPPPLLLVSPVSLPVISAMDSISSVSVPDSFFFFVVVKVESVTPSKVIVLPLTVKTKLSFSSL